MEQQQITPASQPVAGPTAEPEYAALVAIDWADKKHYWALSTPGGKPERGILENTPEAVEAWAVGLSARFGDRPIAVAVEQRKGALVAMLSKYKHIHLYPVHPRTLAKFRQALYPSGSKDDRKDTDLLLEILSKHRAHLRRLDPDTTEMRLLQFQVENRRKLVDDRTVLGQRLLSVLKVYFPQIARWFTEVSSELVCDLLRQWPTLEELQKVRPAQLEKFFRQHRWSDDEKIQKRIAEIRQSIPATADPAVIGSSRVLVAAWIGQLATLHQSIRELEKEIAKLARKQEDWAIFESFPGAADVLAPRLMAALGTQRERYQSAQELGSFSGIAPVREASGNSEWIHFRRACPKFVRQTFHEWAACSLPHCQWARSHYEQMTAKGKGHHAAVRSVAFKWIRILYRCWKTRQPYQEQIYLASVNRRKDASLIQLAKAVQMP